MKSSDLPINRGTRHLYNRFWVSVYLSIYLSIYTAYIEHTLGVYWSGGTIYIYILQYIHID